MGHKYTPLSGERNLRIVGEACTFLNGPLKDALANKTPGCRFSRHENHGLKPRIEGTMFEAISAILNGNEYWPEDWRERVRDFRHALGRLKYFLVLTDAAHERGYIPEDEAGKWQEVIANLTRGLNGLISAALSAKGKG